LTDKNPFFKYIQTKKDLRTLRELTASTYDQALDQLVEIRKKFSKENIVLLLEREEESFMRNSYLSILNILVPSTTVLNLGGVLSINFQKEAYAPYINTI
jgi:hypothetical protein